MTRIIACTFALALTALPVRGEEPPVDGRGLMERGVELFFEGLREEMEPSLDELRNLAEQFGPSMRSFVEEMGPALADLFDEVRDWTAYHPPEMLPNGDIILRKRRPDEGEAKPDAPEPPQGPTDI